MTQGAKKVWDWGRQLFTLAASTQKNTKDIQELTLKVDRLAEAVRELARRQEYEREIAKRDRENQELRLRLILSEAGIKVLPQQRTQVPQLLPSPSHEGEAS